jgi:hypothetical protein
VSASAFAFAAVSLAKATARRVIDIHTILPKKQYQRLRNLRVVVRCVATLA